MIDGAFAPKAAAEPATKLAPPVSATAPVKVSGPDSVQAPFAAAVIRPAPEMTRDNVFVELKA